MPLSRTRLLWKSDYNQASVWGMWIQSRGVELVPRFFLWVRVRPLQEPCPAAPRGESCGEDRCPLNLQIQASLAEHMSFFVLLSLSFWASIAEQCLFKLVNSPFKRHFAVSLGAHLGGRDTFTHVLGTGV